MWFKILLAVGLMILGYLLKPKPKGPKPAEVTDLPDPVAEAGAPIPVVFGTMTTKGNNVIWYGQKSHEKSEVAA